MGRLQPASRPRDHRSRRRAGPPLVCRGPAHRRSRQGGGRASRGPAVSTPPMDPLLERAGVLLGAAGDVLASAPRDSGADPMLADANVQAAQSRVAALLAAAAHTCVRALGWYDGCKTLTREASRDLATSLMKVEQLATAVFQSSPTIAGRADDVRRRQCPAWPVAAGGRDRVMGPPGAGHGPLPVPVGQRSPSRRCRPLTGRHALQGHRPHGRGVQPRRPRWWPG